MYLGMTYRAPRREQEYLGMTTTCASRSTRDNHLRQSAPAQIETAADSASLRALIRPHPKDIVARVWPRTHAGHGLLVSRSFFDPAHAELG